MVWDHEVAGSNPVTPIFVVRKLNIRVKVMEYMGYINNGALIKGCVVYLIYVLIASGVIYYIRPKPDEADFEDPEDPEADYKRDLYGVIVAFGLALISPVIILWFIFVSTVEILLKILVGIVKQIAKVCAFIHGIIKGLKRKILGVSLDEEILESEEERLEEKECLVPRNKEGIKSVKQTSI